MTERVDALSVACPSCGAVAGERCWSGTRRGRYLSRGYHADRCRVAAGEHVPQSVETFLRGEIRRIEIEVAQRLKDEDKDKM